MNHVAIEFFNIIRFIMLAARVFVYVLLSICVFAKRFETRCKVVRELLKVGMPNDIFLGQWVCLIEKVSHRDTRALVVSPSGKKSYGLFQIPGKWCREGRRGGDCNIACESLLDDDIRDDTACAVTIFHREGFKYWSQWSARCKNDKLITNEIYKCPDLNSPRSSPDRILPSEALKSSPMLSSHSSKTSIFRHLFSHY